MTKPFVQKFVRRLGLLGLVSAFGAVALVACGGADKKAPITKITDATNNSPQAQKLSKLAEAPCLDIPGIQSQIISITQPMMAYVDSMDLLTISMSGKPTPVSDDTIRAKILFADPQQKGVFEMDDTDGKDVQNSPVVGEFLNAASQDTCTSVTFVTEGSKSKVFKANGTQTKGSLSLISDDKEQRTFSLDKSGTEMTTLTIKVAKPITYTCDSGSPTPVYLKRTLILSWGNRPVQINRSFAELIVLSIKNLSRELKTVLTAAPPAATNPNAVVQGQETQAAATAANNRGTTLPVGNRPRPIAPLPINTSVSADQVQLTKSQYSDLTNTVNNASLTSPNCKIN